MRCIVTPSSNHSNSHSGNPPSSGESVPSNLAQAEAQFAWWYGPALSDPQMGDMLIVLATIPPRGSIGFAAHETAGDAARLAVELSAHSNVYTHVALHAPDRPKGKGSIETALCLPGLVTDLDAQSPFRSSNEGKAPDVASLRLLIADFEHHYGFPLTVIESGFGLYAIVRFREPLFLGDKASRAEADNLLMRFTEGFRVFSRKRGWPNTVDRVGLAGLIRVSGTLNRKGSTPLPVRFSDARNGVR
jgi:hypothetical protein